MLAESTTSWRARAAEVAFGDLYRLPLGEKDLVDSGSDADFTRIKQLKDLASAGRVISASVSDVLTFSDSIDVSAESQEGDD